MISVREGGRLGAEAAANRDASLPEGWAQASVADLMALYNGRAFKPSDWRTSGYPIVRIQNLNNPAAPYNYSDEEPIPRFAVTPGDLLFAWSGTPGTSFGAHVWTGDYGWLNQHIFRVEFNEALLDKRYLRWAINRNLTSYIEDAHGGVGLAHITKGTFETSTLPIPPLAEQRRIVAKVEELLARVDATRERLARVPLILKRFRQAVLAAACSGRLTEDWRAEHPEESPARGSVGGSASSSSRRRRGRLWGAGIVAPLTEAERAEVPDTWLWVKVRDTGADPEQTVQVGPMSMQSRDFTESGVPVLNVGCVQWGSFDETKLNYLPPHKAGSFNRYLIEAGDILFTRSGTVGRCAVASERQHGYLMTFHLLRVRPDSSTCLPVYLQHVFTGAKHIRRQTEEAAIGSTRAGFNTNLLADLDVPLPPIHEQQEIVRRVEALFRLADSVEQRVAAATARADKLTQSILAKAFRGELVPTEAELARAEGRDYETAEQLLERMRAERAAEQTNGTRRRTPQKAAPASAAQLALLM